MSQGLLTAGSGQGWENELVAALDRPGSPMTVLRRCVDISDVLAVATTGQAAVAVVSADLRRLDTDAVTRLRSSGVAVVGVHPAADDNARTRLLRIGITALVADDAGVDALVAAARVAVAEITDDAHAFPVALGAANPRAALPPPGAGADVQIADGPPLRGSVVAVWGPTGAPGRTLLATNLAVEAAAQSVPTLLIDADVYGGVVSSAFGLLDESPGLAGACRLAATGQLDLGSLAGLCWSLGDDLRLLTGIARADRWPEVRPSAIPLVLDAAREMAPLTVVDCAFALEADERLSSSTTPRGMPTGLRRARHGVQAMELRGEPMKIRHVAPAAVACLVLLAGCGSGTTAGTGGATVTQQVPTTVTATVTTVPATSQPSAVATASSVAEPVAASTGGTLSPTAIGVPAEFQLNAGSNANLGTVTLNGYEWATESPWEGTGSGASAFPENDGFLVLDVTVNGTKGRVFSTEYGWLATGADGTEFKKATWDNFKPDLAYKQLAAGESSSGKVALDVQRGPVTVTWKGEMMRPVAAWEIPA